MAKLTVAATSNFTGQQLLRIDTIDFTNPPGSLATATFSGGQFGGVRISPQVLIDGSSGVNAIVVNGTGLPVDASGWRFINWDLLDSVLIRGNSLSETLTGSSQNDTILGLGGSDTIDGGAGNDIVEGGASLDRLSGGSGNDTLSYAASPAAVTINMATGLATGGDAFGDRFSGFENVSGSAYNDTLRGDAAANSLTGGNGRDTMTGGADADRFVFTAIGQSVPNNNRDVITDFNHVQGDLIDLSAIDAVPGGLDNGFTFIGTAAFTAPGQVRYLHSSGQTIVQVNVDGSGIADMEIGLTGTQALTAGDFIL